MSFNDQGQDATQQQPTFEPTQYQPNLDHVNHLNHAQAQQQPQQAPQQPQPAHQDGSPSVSTTGKNKQRRSSPIPRIRRACVQCHSGKTKCSDSLPCQSCIKRGLSGVCTYPDPDSEMPQPPQSANKLTAGQVVQVAPTQGSFVQTVPTQPQPPPQQQQQQPAAPQAAQQHQQQPGPYYYDYQANSSTFRAAKRPRPLTEDETAAITKNFQRGAFYIGTSQPIRIDPRLPVRLTLGEGDQVHFEISSDIA